MARNLIQELQDGINQLFDSMKGELNLKVTKIVDGESKRVDATLKDIMEMEADLDSPLNERTESEK